MVDGRAPEFWRLLEYVSIHDSISDGDEDTVDSLLAAVDWDRLVVVAIKHRLAARVADFLVRSGRASFVPTELLEVLLRWLHQNRHAGALAAAEAARVVDALTERAVAVACTKGVVFQSTLYCGFGGRSFDDIDLMIHPDDKDTMADVLVGLGYLANMEHDLLTDSLTGLSRRDMAMYRMYPDHLPHFFRPMAGSAVPYHAVDVCFNITWYDAAWQIPMTDVLAERARVEVAAADTVLTLPGLIIPYDFIFTAMHLFRESWFERAITTGNLRLGQFADVQRLWQHMNQSDKQELAALIDKYALAPPVAWVCHHVDELFGTDIVPGLGLDEYCDEGWLHSAGAASGSYLSWTGSMRERLTTKEPLRLVQAPEPRFAASARVARR